MGPVTTTIKKINIEWDIVILTEINIKKEEVELYEISGYKNITLTKENTARGGGIMVFIKNNYKIVMKQIDIGESNALEIAINEIGSKEKKIKCQILVIYRKPSTKKN